MAFCPKCGTKIDEGLKFCTGCGTPVGGSLNNAGTVIPEQAKTGVPLKKKNIKRNVLILVVIWVVVMVFFVFLPNLFYEKAQSNFSNNNFDDAIKQYNIAIRLSLLPSSDDYLKYNCYYGLGKIYHEKALYDEAIGWYTKAIKLKPTNSTSYQMRGNVYKDKGDYDQALADYNEIIRMSPDFAFYYQIRGDFYMNIGEYDRAIVDFEEALRLGNSINPKVINEKLESARRARGK